MKKTLKTCLIFTFVFTYINGVNAQNSTGHFVCCRCAGKGVWFSTYLDANSNVQILQINCETCSGTGVGECEKPKPSGPKPPVPNEDRPSKVYYDYLIKAVREGKPIPKPDEFWRTRPDLK